MKSPSVKKSRPIKEVRHTYHALPEYPGKMFRFPHVYEEVVVNPALVAAFVPTQKVFNDSYKEVARKARNPPGHPLPLHLQPISGVKTPVEIKMPPAPKPTRFQRAHVWLAQTIKTL